jgi:translation initiation factor 3 subunit H
MASFDGPVGEEEVPVDVEPMEAIPRVKEVVIDGVAVLKIVKHCNDNLPTMVAGSLLGLDVDGVLEVTYTYPFPTPKDRDEGGDEDDLEGREYQIDMMNMLRDVNVDNNCVGWYQSTYLSTMCTNDVVGYQYSYQSSDELSDNSVVIMYDPIQSKTDNGKLVIRAFRLTEDFIALRKSKQNKYINPAGILEELPVRIKNGGYIGGFLQCLKASKREIEESASLPLSMNNGEGFAERNLELMNSWIDDLVVENRKFQDHARNSSNSRRDHQRWLYKRNAENADRRENGEDLLPTKLDASGLKPLPEAPTRTEPLLMIGQLDRYCEQVQGHIDTSLKKIAVTAKLSDA